MTIVPAGVRPRPMEKQNGRASPFNVPVAAWEKRNGTGIFGTSLPTVSFTAMLDGVVRILSHVETRLGAYFMERDIKLGSEVAAFGTFRPMNGRRAYRFFDVHHSPFFSWTMKHASWVPGDAVPSIGTYPFSGDVGGGVGVGGRC